MNFSIKYLLAVIYYYAGVCLLSLLLNYLFEAEQSSCKNCAEMASTNTYDYIIVGCGSAGSIVAKRLAQNPNNKILILEAGGQSYDFLNIPSLGLALQKTPFDWQYKTVSQKHSAFALDEAKSRWPMGRIVGGTNMFNNLMYVRGHKDDYKNWFLDKPDFDYNKDVLSYLKKIEQDLSDVPYTSILPEYVLKAVKSLNISVMDSLLEAEEGFSKPKVHIKNGRRWTTAHSLFSSNFPNIKLYTHSVVEKVLFKSNYDAYAVKYLHNDQFYYANATKGIILSAGVIGTPKILMLSGIGPIDHLNSLGIQPILNLPVGENLQDHLTTGFNLVLLNQTIGLGLSEMLSPFSAYKYFSYGTGPWTTIGCETLGFYNAMKSEKRPDLQFMIMPLGITEDHGFYLRHLIGINDHIWQNYFNQQESTDTPVSFLPVLLHPKSRGTIRLTDKNVKSMPLINPNYLSNEEDVEVLYRGIEFIKTLINTESMQQLGAKINSIDYPNCYKKYKFDTKDYWKCYIRDLTITSYHPVGTCAMGTNGVVDFNFQVKNTNKLFVVDGSVLPNLPSGNVNGPIMMMAEMASDVIRNNEFMNRGKCGKMEEFVDQKICYF